MLELIIFFIGMCVGFYFPKIIMFILTRKNKTFAPVAHPGKILIEIIEERLNILNDSEIDPTPNPIVLIRAIEEKTHNLKSIIGNDLTQAMNEIPKQGEGSYKLELIRLAAIILTALEKCSYETKIKIEE